MHMHLTETRQEFILIPVTGTVKRHRGTVFAPGIRPGLCQAEGQGRAHERAADIRAQTTGPDQGIHEFGKAGGLWSCPCVPAGIRCNIRHIQNPAIRGICKAFANIRNILHIRHIHVHGIDRVRARAIIRRLSGAGDHARKKQR